MSPGAAVIEVRDRIPTLIAASSVATSTADNDAVRSVTVESFIAQMVYAHRPFYAVVREDFTSGRNKRATQTIFNSWVAADRALHTFGYEVLDLKPPLSPTSVKKIVTGNGKAEKPEVAAAVRNILRLGDDYKFATGYDDSDACAVALAYLISKGLIDV
ncbi:crossover junction endodeoxyribonuclease RuvC [Paenibacillus sp. HWE-109]|uniref:crossover junction endodeoxyribonuclease RuvC n=1 Tax=Paenibacillus sp. HWE-109 TaxID=1306526 RepID=UPI001EDEFE38|nr:crossover junction endodeoxyribonuclease RuvC [Paenibacillus sp. HWE-109]UKS30190.1 crossover junction endodeoxyribonuclease RuvC [Paenibacillus sp. HWE-109]